MEGAQIRRRRAAAATMDGISGRGEERRGGGAESAELLEFWADSQCGGARVYSLVSGRRTEDDEGGLLCSTHLILSRQSPWSVMYRPLECVHLGLNFTKKCLTAEHGLPQTD
jgi:hypothetical protein